MTRWRLRLLPFALVAMLNGGNAADKTVNMRLKISINALPPCSITTDNVEFGNVLTTKVNGTNYQQKLNYSLDCSSRINDFLKLQIQGTAVVINGESVLETDVPGLGIRLQMGNDNKLIPPGLTDWLPFQYQGSSGPDIQAVLVKNSNVTLTGGEFNAVATLVVDYQ